MGKNILITGGNGFIGRCLIKRLSGYDSVDLLHVVDNLCNSDYPDEEFFKTFPKVKMSIQSVSDFQPERRYHEIWHLASPVGPAGVLNYAGQMAPMIVSDTSKIAHMALSMGARMIDISTSEVYGKDPGDIPQEEDIDKIVPADITVRLEYGVAKLASEVSLKNLHDKTGLHVNIIRPFNIIGVGQKGEVGFVLPRFVQQALSGEPLTVFGDGTQKRTFTSVEDIVDAMILVMSSSVKGEVFNVGNPSNICSILDLAKKVKHAASSSSDIIFVDPTTIYGKYYKEAWNKIPNIDKVQRTGWYPSRSLDQIIQEVIKVERGY